MNLRDDSMQGQELVFNYPDESLPIEYILLLCDSMYFTPTLILICTVVSISNFKGKMKGPVASMRLLLLSLAGYHTHKTF